MTTQALNPGLGRRWDRMVVVASHSPLMVRDRDREQGLHFRAGLAAARDGIASFAPELVVMFGGDHRRAFTSIVPPFAVVTRASGLGDLGSPSGPYNVPAQLSLDLSAHLQEDGFDVTRARDVELDHGFGQTIGDIIGLLDSLPLIPIFINCAAPPLPTCRRVFDLGSSVGRFLQNLNLRVLIIGSGGLSHSPPSLEVDTFGLSDAQRRAINDAGLERAKLAINSDWDESVLRLLEVPELQQLADFTDEQIAAAGVGAHEIRTWIGAVAAAGVPLQILGYEPVQEWITGMAIMTGTGNSVLVTND